MPRKQRDDNSFHSSIPIEVYGRGPCPATIMVIGEAPGAQEAYKGQPFVGKSGFEQEQLFRIHSNGKLNPYEIYYTNVCKSYLEGNPDPTPELIAYWTDTLLDEVRSCNPRLIIAVGRFAAQFFLGDHATMDLCWGIPCRSGEFDPSRSNRAPRGCVILPIYHPAGGFHNPELRPVIAAGYSKIYPLLCDIRRGKEITYRKDQYAGQETYLDINGYDLVDTLSILSENEIAIDTEGYPADPWSVQFSPRPGTGYLLRYNPHDQYSIRGFQHAIDWYINSFVSQGGITILHNAMYDIEMCRNMGLNLSAPHIRIFDTMYAAYLLRLEPQKLKSLAWRWSGMVMKSHDETVGQVARQYQVKYLEKILASKDQWPLSEPEIIYKNDGTVKVYKPQPIWRRAENILRDILENKRDKDDELIDPLERWKDISKRLRRPVEQSIGPMPIGSMKLLYREDPEAAILYSCKDPDATLRIKDPLATSLRSLNLYDEFDATNSYIGSNPSYKLMNSGMDVLPIFEEMQSRGMPVSQLYFTLLQREILEKMAVEQGMISGLYWDNQPFNPGSPSQIAELMARRGLTGEKKTKSGRISTSKPSIEHLRHVDDSMERVINWKEHAKVLSAFVNPVLDKLAEGPEPIKLTEEQISSIIFSELTTDDFTDIQYALFPIKITRVATRRIASYLLTIPTRKDLGRRVREGYIAPPGYVFVSADASIIELRVAADESRDPLLCAVFNEGRDAHSEAASRMFSIPLDQVDKMKHRYPAKTTGYGILYGLQSEGLQTQFRMNNVLGYTLAELDSFINGWLDTYSGVRDSIQRAAHDCKWINKQAGILNRMGEVRSRGGMIRYLPGIHSKDSSIAEEAARIAYSHKIQATAQEMIQESMRWMRPIIYEMQMSGLDVRWMLQVHDELILMCPEDLAEMIRDLIIEAITQHVGYQLIVPLVSSGSIARSWGKLK